VNSEMHVEAVIERVWGCTWRPSSSELRNALGGHNRASLEMHLEDVIERDWRCTWKRPMGCSRREVRWVLRISSSVSSFATVGM